MLTAIKRIGLTCTLMASKTPMQESGQALSSVEDQEGRSKTTNDSGFMQQIDPAVMLQHFHALQSPACTTTSSPLCENQPQDCYDCGSPACTADRLRLRRQLERAVAENILLHRENSEMALKITSMQRTLTCSQIVEGHSHLVEKCQELQSELNHVTRINENTTEADKNKSDRIELLQVRLKEVKSNLDKKEHYIELLHEELADLFQHLKLEASDTKNLKEVTQELEQRLKSAQEHNQLHLNELLEFFGQIKELKETTSILRDELEMERNIRRDIVRRTSSNCKDKCRPLSVPIFCEKP